MQNKGARSKHLFPAVVLEFAHRGNTAFTVEIIIRNSKGNLTELEERGISPLPLPFVTFSGIRETAQWLISQMVWYETVIREMIARKANGQWK